MAELHTSQTPVKTKQTYLPSNGSGLAIQCKINWRNNKEPVDEPVPD